MLSVLCALFLNQGLEFLPFSRQIANNFQKKPQFLYICNEILSLVARSTSQQTSRDKSTVNFSPYKKNIFLKPEKICIIIMNLIEETPWKKLTAKDNRILFRFLTSEDFSYLFQWTDLIDLYQEKLSPGNITKRWNLLNKAVETELDGQIEAIESGLSTPLSIRPISPVTKPPLSLLI